MKRIAFVIGACSLAIAATACRSSSDSVTAAQATLQLTRDDTLAAVTTSAAQGTLGDLDVIGSAESTLGFQLAPPGNPALSLNLAGGRDLLAGYAAATGCTLNASTGRFDCSPTTNNGLTLTRSFAFYNASGTLMPKFNDTTTASVNITTTETGVRPSATGADTISGSRSMTATGLVGHNTSRTWNGTGSRTVGGYYADSAASRTYDNQENTTFTNIVVQLPRSSNPYPASGSITRQVSCTGNVTKGGKSKAFTTTKTVIITFNGTEFVPMTVGGTSYTLDLATGKATKN